MSLYAQQRGARKKSNSISTDCLCLLFIHPRAPNLISLRSAGCAPQKLDPSLILQFRPARIGRFAANG